MFSAMLKELEAIDRADEAEKKKVFQDMLGKWQERCNLFKNYYSTTPAQKQMYEKHLTTIMSLNLENKQDYQDLQKQIKQIKIINNKILNELATSYELAGALDTTLKDVMKIPEMRSAFNVKVIKARDEKAPEPDEKKWKDVLPTAQKLLKGGCDLHIKPSLPDNLSSYANSYILVKDQLNYIDYDGIDCIRENVTIINPSKFLADLKQLNPENKDKIQLSKNVAASLITSNTLTKSNKGHAKTMLSEEQDAATIKKFLDAVNGAKIIFKMQDYKTAENDLLKASEAYQAVASRYSISELRDKRFTANVNFIEKEMRQVIDVKREQYLKQAKELVIKVEHLKPAKEIRDSIIKIEDNIKALMNDVASKEHASDFKKNEESYREQLKKIESDYHAIKGRRYTKGSLEQTYPKIHDKARMGAKTVAADEKREKSKSSAVSESKSTSDKSENLQGQSAPYSPPPPNRQSSTNVSSEQTKLNIPIVPRSAWDEAASPSSRQSVGVTRQRSVTTSSSGSAGILRRVSAVETYQELQHLQGDGRTSGKDEKFPQISPPGLGDGRPRSLFSIQQTKKEEKFQESPTNGRSQESPESARDEGRLFQRSPKSPR